MFSVFTNSVARSLAFFYDLCVVICLCVDCICCFLLVW